MLYCRYIGNDIKVMGTHTRNVFPPGCQKREQMLYLGIESILHYIHFYFFHLTPVMPSLILLCVFFPLWFLGRVKRTSETDRNGHLFYSYECSVGTFKNVVP